MGSEARPRTRITIVGTGLIGASIGLRLCSLPNRTFEVVGIDRDPEQIRTAKKRGAIDREARSFEDAVEGAGLVVLAVPILAGPRVMRDLAPYLSPGAVVTDTFSTKNEVLSWAAEYLPEGVSFVGGHPMAGKEENGAAAADAALFEGATWAIVPSPTASEAAVRTVVGMVEALGARPAYFDAAEHDQLTAAISHLPLFLSVALFRMVRDSPSWEDAALLAGPGFRDTTRLASGDPVLAQGIWRTNREALLHWLDRFTLQLRELRSLLADPEREEELGQLVTKTKLDRDVFIENPPRREPPSRAVDVPSTADALGQFIAGAMYQRLKEYTAKPPPIRPDDPALRRKLGIDDDD
ncbi:Prephenate dehydrogenase [bacterium HR29]|jgi:prephenate dehydrogenase|nr:Prephenate dehydrogenase [bacterium HR29]